MRRELHIFTILSVIACVLTLGPDRAVLPYLHVFLPFLQLALCSNESCPVQGWSSR